MKRALLAVSAGLFAASLGLALMLMRDVAAPDLAAPQAIDPAAVASLYEVALPDAEGRSQPLAQWRGKVLVVNWWATWCHPCRDEMPEFSRLQERYAGRGVQFVGIAADEADKVVPHARTSPVAYPLLVGGQEAIKLARPLGNEPLAVPFTIVLDREGKLRAAALGRIHEDALIRLLESLV